MPLVHFSSQQLPRILKETWDVRNGRATDLNLLPQEEDLFMLYSSIMHYIMFSVYLAKHAVIYCMRGVSHAKFNGMWRQGLCVTRLTFCPRSI